MIEVKGGTIEEKIIKQLQKSYPISIKDLEKKIHISRIRIIRVLQKLQVISTLTSLISSFKQSLVIFCL